MPEMDTAVLAFLGGALGAALAAWTSLHIDRRQREEAQRHRYSPENRALFIEYLRLADERVLAVRKQAEAAWEWSQGRVPEEAIPTLGTTDELELMLHRIEDAMPSGTISPLSARLLFLDVTRIDHRSFRPWVAPFNPHDDPEWRAGLTWVEEARALVRDTYQVDVGAVTRRYRSPLESARTAVKTLGRKRPG